MRVFSVYVPCREMGERRRIAVRRKLLPNGRCNNYLCNEKGKEKYSLEEKVASERLLYSVQLNGTQFLSRVEESSVL